MFNYNYLFRASIALLVIVVVTCQLCLLPNQSQYTYSTDQAIEKLTKADPFDDDHINLDGFVPDDILIPLLEDHQQLPLYKASQLFLVFTLSHSIRSPPRLQQNLTVVS